ncbi:DEAD/DEAH box helicase family protein [Paenibacillus sp. Soil724D2]|uniref:DEAD/DEAH box helicase family protein n=1 Tax=Paenibacillus sp. (strain Soil724D2) TaxID=1736392 RepID=UPI0007151339|nr:DEAD/DEAH box helicase family protein [Paenibacillus sp. Soil724D2]KRE48375.1 hypothetical protein ASG85_05070 [Paenibacillus sp. Soil724D2]
MPLNVDFLNNFPQWQTLHDYASEAEKNVYSNPRTSLFYCRAALERAVRWMYATDGYLEYPDKEKPTLSDLIHTASFQETIAVGLFQPIKLIIRVGNLAVHDDSPLSKSESSIIFEHLFTFLNWLQDYYWDAPLEGLAFKSELIPTAVAASTESIEQLRILEGKLEKQEERIQKLEAENTELRKQLAQIPRKQKPPITMTPENEARTRQLIIDVMLREAEWDPHGENVREYEVAGMPNHSGLGYCDYVLWSDANLPLAVIEAKKTTVSAETGKNQAVGYAKSLEDRYGQRPIVFYTNGYETWMWDEAFYPPRRVASFYSKADLEWAIQKRTERKDTRDFKVNPAIAGRSYQIEAIKRVSERYGKGHRKALLVMATGTGKTRTAIALVDFLKSAGWVRNALFLADRIELVDQACGEFKKHLPTVTTCNLLEDKEDDSARLYFSTYKTLLNLIRPGVTPKFSTGFFDLIIIDEAHRSIYSKFRLLFQYFDSILLGLTATPKSDVDHDTYQFFQMPPGVPTFAYEYEKAIGDKNLVPVKPVKMPTKFTRDGIDPDQLTAEERADYEANVTPLAKGKKKIAASDINQFLYNRDTIRKVLEGLFKHGIKVAGGDRLGKTIIFARNQKHAKLIVEVFDELNPQYRGKFALEISDGVKGAKGLIKDFKNPEGNPHIAVSVDMLDTGIDVPEVVNLVLFKPVFSLSKFWQMIGRGTRLREDLFGPGFHKTHALLFDVCGNVDAFKDLGNPADPPSGQIPLTEQLFRERVLLVQDLQMAGNDYQDLRKELVSGLVSQLAHIDEHYFAVRPHLPVLLRYRDSAQWEFLDDRAVLDLTKTMAPLMYDEEPEDKKRVDLLHVQLQRGRLGVAVHQLSSKQKKLQSIAERLLKKNVQQVTQHVDMLRAIRDLHFFERTSAIELHEIRKIIRELIRLLDHEEKDIVHTDFQDQLGNISFEEDLPVSADFTDYREYISQFVRQHQDHVAIQRLRRNKPITMLDIEAFTAVLEVEKPGTKEQFNELFVSGSESSFGLFVRSLLGLEREAALELFAELLQKTDLNANQITFIHMIIDYLCENGVLEPAKLLQEPFVRMHKDGVFGLFEEKIVDSIVKIVNSIDETAKIKTG